MKMYLTIYNIMMMMMNDENFSLCRSNFKIVYWSVYNNNLDDDDPKFFRVFIVVILTIAIWLDKSVFCFFVSSFHIYQSIYMMTLDFFLFLFFFAFIKIHALIENWIEKRMKWFTEDGALSNLTIPMSMFWHIYKEREREKKSWLMYVCILCVFDVIMEKICQHGTYFFLYIQILLPFFFILFIGIVRERKKKNE